MRFKGLFASIAIVSMIGCGIDKGKPSPTPTAPSLTQFADVGASAELVKAFANVTVSGPTTATVGANGVATLHGTFNDPSNVGVQSVGNDLHVTITWVRGSDSANFDGSLTGNPGHININPTDVNSCGFKAEGALVGTAFIGTYEGVGNACDTFAGSFIIDGSVVSILD